MEELTTPPDAEPPKPIAAATAKRVTLERKLVSKDYVDERMSAISDLIQKSFEPALALLPSSLRKGIQEAFDALMALIGEAKDGDA